jgi:DNA-binding transcriptional MerR regulator
MDSYEPHSHAHITAGSCRFLGQPISPLDLGVHSQVYHAYMSMTVSELAGQAGLPPDTVRYYLKIGLLPAPERTPAGYRLLDESLVDRLRFIKGAQGVGLRLREIAELLEIMDKGNCPCGHTEMLLQQRLAEVKQEIAKMAHLKGTLTKMLDQYPASQCFFLNDKWPCEQEFIQAGGR